MMKVKPASLRSNESYLTLGCILGFLGVPNMIIGNQIAQTYGVMWAILSILIGNLVLWLFGLGIVSMTEGKSHAIENIRNQFGKTSSFLAIILIVSAFLMWYTLQLSKGTSNICSVLEITEKWKIGLAIGSVISILSIGGFRAVKWSCLIGLPILVIIAVFFIAISNAPI
jgi:hypothetical protein